MLGSVGRAEPCNPPPPSRRAGCQSRVRYSLVSANSEASTGPASSADPPPRYPSGKPCAESDRKSHIFGRFVADRKFIQQSIFSRVSPKLQNETFERPGLDSKVICCDLWHLFCIHFYCVFSNCEELVLINNMVL